MSDNTTDQAETITEIAEEIERDASAPTGGTRPDESGTAAEDTEPDTFPRAYVQELRSENAKYRDRAKSADALAQRLHVELVKATGRLADPTDLAFDAEHLDDADKMAAALDALLAAKPHLKSRKPAGDIGQGITGTPAGVSLLDLMRGGVS